jgi:hypothetical protein
LRSLPSIELHLIDLSLNHQRETPVCLVTRIDYPRSDSLLAEVFHSLIRLPRNTSDPCESELLEQGESRLAGGDVETNQSG